MVLHLIGIGYKKEHINFEQIEKIKNSEEVFLEYYTSFYQDSFENLENFIDKKISVCSREIIENSIEKDIILKAKTKDISLLIIGDPLIATTHTDLILRSKELKVDIKIYNNISIGNLLTQTGLNFYKFGKFTSIPFFFKNFMPVTPYLYFLENMKINSHTCFLLDLDPIKNTYLSITDSIDFLFQIREKLLEEKTINKENETELITENTKAIVCSQLGFDSQKIVYSSLKDIKEMDLKEKFKEPLCLIIPSKMNEVEKNYLDLFKK